MDSDIVQQLKSLGEFGADGLKVAISNRLDGVNQQTLLDLLHAISDILPEEPSKEVVLSRKRKNTTPSTEDIFYSTVIPQIRCRITEYERQDIDWSLNLKFKLDFNNMPLDEMKREHNHILQQENNVASLDLLVKYHRGLLYLASRSKRPNDVNAKDWYFNEFGVKYETALRYMNFAAMIRNYPGLIVSGLGFSQIVKHSQKLIIHLKNDSALAAKLAVRTSVAAQRTSLLNKNDRPIRAKNVINLSHL